MPEAATDIAGTFRIKEITGEGRALELAGRALPYRPFTLTGSQRVELTWYPGNPVATAQVLGAAEEVTTITGFWKDRFIATAFSVGGAVAPEEGVETPPATLDGEVIADVAELVKSVDDIRRKGQLLEVSWKQVSRRGFITRFAQTWHNLRDCEWEMELTWTSRGEDGPGALLVAREADLQDAAESTLAKVADLARSVETSTSTLEGIADAVNTQVTQLEALAGEVNDALLGAVDGVMSPVDAARRAAGVMESIVLGAGALIGDAQSRVYESLPAVEDAAGKQDVAAVALGAAVGAALSRATIVSQARRARHDAARNRARLIRSIDPELARTFFAREGQDLREVSIAFFGTADQWQAIARFNGLSSSRLCAGQVVLVPQSPHDERRM